MPKRPDEAHLKRVKLLVFDFDGVFTDNKVFVFQDGREAVRCDRGDGMGVSRLRKKGFDMMILSTEENPVVGARAKKLKIACVQGVADKLKELSRIAKEKNVTLGEIAYVGNDINDIDVLKNVGLPIVVSDAFQEVIDAADSCVTSAQGGKGAVREVCDWFYNILRDNG